MSITTIIPTVGFPSSVSYPIKESITNFQNGLSTGINSVTYPLQLDVPLSPIYTFTAVPCVGFQYCIVSDIATITIAANSSVILPLNTGTFTNSGIKAAQPYTFNGVPGVLLDMERNVIFSYSTNGAFNIQMTGYDFRGQLFCNTLPAFVAPPYDVDLGTVSFITEIKLTNTTNAPVTVTSIGVGTANSATSEATRIGLPYFLPDATYVISAQWAGAAVPLADIFAGFNWRSPLNSGTVYNTSASPRGYIQTPTEANSANKLVCTYYVQGADPELDNLLVNKNQSAYKVANIQLAYGSMWTASPPVLVWPNLINYDLTGMQINQGTAALSTNPGADTQAYKTYQNLIAPGTVT